MAVWPYGRMGRMAVWTVWPYETESHAATIRLYGNTAPTASIVSQGLIEVCNQVFHVLDPDGKPHQAVGEAHLALELGWDAGVGHRGGVAHEALDAAQRLGEHEDFGALHQAPPPAHVAELHAH